MDRRQIESTTRYLRWTLTCSVLFLLGQFALLQIAGNCCCRSSTAGNALRMFHIQIRGPRCSRFMEGRDDFRILQPDYREELGEGPRALSTFRQAEVMFLISDEYYESSEHLTMWEVQVWLTRHARGFWGPWRVSQPKAAIYAAPNAPARGLRSDADAVQELRAAVHRSTERDDHRDELRRNFEIAIDPNRSAPPIHAGWLLFNLAGAAAVMTAILSFAGLGHMTDRRE